MIELKDIEAIAERFGWRPCMGGRAYETLDDRMFEYETLTMTGINDIWAGLHAHGFDVAVWQDRDCSTCDAELASVGGEPSFNGISATSSEALVKATVAWIRSEP